MMNIFAHTSATWVRYSDYEWRQAPDGYFYLLPAPDAVPSIYTPTKVTNELVLAAVEIGRALIGKTSPEKGRALIREFACQYGLLGIMTALPTTADFIVYEKVYFPRNAFIREESMDTVQYLKYFYPFKMPNFKKKGVESVWNTRDEDDNLVKALMLTYTGKRDPQAMAMSFIRDYGERYEWMAEVFKDWAFTLMATHIYYDKSDPANETTRKVYESGMAAFEGNAPTYHLELRDKPVIVWDYYSLMLCVKLMLNVMMTDEAHPIRLCRQCMKPFLVSEDEAEFCSPQCRRKYRREHK